MTGHDGIEVDLESGVEDLVEWWVAPGQLRRLDPVVDVLVKLCQWDRGTGHASSRIEVPSVVGSELEGTPDWLGHALGEEGGRCIRFDPGRKAVDSIL